MLLRERRNDPFVERGGQEGFGTSGVIARVPFPGIPLGVNARLLSRANGAFSVPELPNDREKAWWSVSSTANGKHTSDGAPAYGPRWRPAHERHGRRGMRDRPTSVAWQRGVKRREAAAQQRTWAVQSSDWSRSAGGLQSARLHSCTAAPRHGDSDSDSELRAWTSCPRRSPASLAAVRRPRSGRRARLASDLRRSSRRRHWHFTASAVNQ